MFRSLSVLAVIPARGGSKGVPKKNIALVLSKPLILYTTELCAAVPWIDATVVSTDCKEIASVAQQTGGIEIIWRPEELSGDRVGDHPVLAHALLRAEESLGRRFDLIIMLQPTSPLRNISELEDCVSKLIDGCWDAVWTVSETPLAYHPLKQLEISQGGGLEFFVPEGQAIIARQQLKPAFHRNGACYAFTRDFLLSASSTWSESKTAALITPGRHISVDTIEDLTAVELLISEKLH